MMKVTGLHDLLPSRGRQIGSLSTNRYLAIGHKHCTGRRLSTVVVIERPLYITIVWRAFKIHRQYIYGGFKYSLVFFR